MDLSSGVPRGRGLGSIASIVRARTTAVTVTRPSVSKGSLDETTESTSEHTEDIWLFEPRESVTMELAGERINGSLGGLVDADGTVDLQNDDRVTHGGVEYELDTIVGHPDDGEPDGTASDGTDFWILSFERRQ
jgi:hypothetical protein